MNLPIKKAGFFFFLFLSAATIFAQGTNQKYLNYIDKYKGTAITEMSRTGIPASVKLAQAVLESGAGSSTLARKAKNHFGIKCGPKWRGKKHYMEDDDFDDFGKKIKSCFRVYKNPISSFIAHSEFLRDPRKAYRYGPLFELDPYDYQAWAFGLKKAGYATAPRYPQMLIKLIEDYDLTQYDRMDDIVYSDDKGKPTHNNDKIFGRLGKVNDLKVFVAKGGESVYQVAFQHNVKIKRLVKYNDAVMDGENKLPEGYKLFLQPKRNNWRGKAAFHYVKKGETLFEISQKYGVKLKKLKRKNRIPDNAQPLAGERIRLRGWHRRNEVVKYKISASREVPPLSSKVSSDQQDGKMPTKKNPADSDLLDIEISPSNEDKDEILIDVDPVITNPNSDLDETTPDEVPPLEDVKDDVKTDIDPAINDNPIIVDDTTVDDHPVKVEDAPMNDAPVKKEPTYITIIKGDTLYSMARAFGLTVSELKALNGLTSNNLKIGQRLRVSK